MKIKTLLIWSTLTLGLAPLMTDTLILAAHADQATNDMDMGGMKMAQKPTATPLSTWATISPAIPKSGDNALDLVVVDAGGKPVTGLKLTGSVAMTSMDMGTTHPAFTETGGGHYKATVNFSMEGPWRVVVRDQAAKIAVLNFQPGSKILWKSPQIRATPETSSAAPSPVAKPPATNPMAGINTSGSEATVKFDTVKPEAMVRMDMSGKDIGMTGMTSGIADMKTATIPELKENGIYIATGDENWKMQTGFGHNAGMVGMMNQMMVGGSGMEGMKMPAMTMKFGEENYAKPDADEANDGMAGMDMSAKPMDASKASSSKPDAMAGMKMGTASPTSHQAVAAESGKPAANDSGKPMAGMKMDAPAPGSTPAAPVKITAVTASTPKAGDNALSITLTDAQGKPVTGATIKTTVAMTSMDMGTTHPAVTEKGAGQYTSTVTFSMAGPWRVFVKVTPPGQKPQSKAFDFNAK